MSRVRSLAVWIARFAVALALILGCAGPAPSTANRAPVPAGAGLRGPQPFLVIPCKFADMEDEPEPSSYYRALLLGPPPSLDDYWREVSYRAINLAGSRVLEWRSLPKRADDYRNPDWSVRLDELGADCMATALADIVANSYAGLAFVFNGLNWSAYAGEACVAASVAPVCRSAVWLWRLSSRKLSVWAHEMGHVFGLDHSTDTAGSAYRDFSDIMGSVDCCLCGQSPSRSAQHPSAWQKRRLGWIPAGREYRVAADGAATIDLQGLAEPVDDGYALAIVEDVRHVGYTYSVEARTLTGYDSALPGAAVVIHRIEPDGDPHPIHLVPHPGDERTAAAASVWLPGAVFRDEVAEVAVAVEARTSTGFRVTLTTGSPARAPVPETPSETLDILSVSTLPVVTMLGLANAQRGAIAVVGGRGRDCGLFAAALHTWRAGLGWQEPEPLPDGPTKAVVSLPGASEGDDGEQVLVLPGVGLCNSGLAAHPCAESVIWAMDRLPGAAWGNTTRLNTPSRWGGAMTPVLAAGGGRVAAAWIEREAGGTRVLLAWRESAGRWSQGIQISDAGRRAFRIAPALAVDGDGNAGAMWIETGPAGNEVWSAFVSPGARPQADIRVDDLQGVRSANPQLAVDGQGNWHAVWTQYALCPEGDSAYASIQTSERPRDGVWEPALTLAVDLDGGSKIAPAVAVGPGGVVYAAWTAYDLGRPAVYLAERSPAGFWSAPRRIAFTGASDLEPPALATSAQDGVLLAWLSGQEGNRRLNSILLPVPR